MKLKDEAGRRAAAAPPLTAQRLSAGFTHIRRKGRDLAGPFGSVLTLVVIGSLLTESDQDVGEGGVILDDVLGELTKSVLECFA